MCSGSTKNTSNTERSLRSGSTLYSALQREGKATNTSYAEGSSHREEKHSRSLCRKKYPKPNIQDSLGVRKQAAALYHMEAKRQRWQ